MDAQPPAIDAVECDVVRSTHRLSNLVRNMRASPGTLRQVNGLLSQIQALLETDAWRGPYAVEQLSPPGEGRVNYDPQDLTRTVPFSPLLGRRNPLSPEVDIRADEGLVRGRIRFSSVYAGPMNTVHGGAVSALFDEILSLANIVKGRMGLTRSISVQFHQPTPLGEWLQFSAECAGASGANLLCGAELRFAGKLTASATAVFKPIFDRTDDPYAATR